MYIGFYIGVFLVLVGILGAIFYWIKGWITKQKYDELLKALRKFFKIKS